MKRFDNISNTIAKFLNNQLKAEALHAFTQKLSSDPELKAEVAFQKTVFEATKSLENQKLSNRIRETISLLEEEEPEASKQTATIIGMSARRRFLFSKTGLASIAASLLVLVTVSVIWYANEFYSNNSIVAKNHLLSSPSYSLKGIENDPAEALFKEVAAAYSAKNYVHAVELLESVEPSSSYTKAQFHLGNLYLKKGQSDKAIASFSTVLESEDKRYVEDVHWLLVLAYLQNEDENKAISQLNTILENPNHSLYSKAKAMKDKLNSLWRRMVF